MQDPKNVEFSGLVLGFSSAALHYLGEGLVDGEKTVQLDLAQYNIDIIKVLQDKTKGNLTPEEENLMNQVLIDLQKKYADVERA